MKARSFSERPDAKVALQIVSGLQKYFVQKLSSRFPDSKTQSYEWLRENGLCGGGLRVEVTDTGINSASINVSQVHYGTSSKKTLEVATALSAIVHPQSPFLPSIHLHISKTTLHDGKSYWRLMVDLNPSIRTPLMTEQFTQSLRQCAGTFYDFGRDQGDKYFYIPPLKRHRGVAHFYLENFATDHASHDERFAEALGRTMIACYSDLILSGINEGKPVTEVELSLQREYHTLYFFQVLTLDRGTTSGILAHRENDVGILGSLPRRVDRALLTEWLGLLAGSRKVLLENLIECLPGPSNLVHVSEPVKISLANSLRAFYERYPDELQNQASGFTVPQTHFHHKS